jgi:3-hydroxyisobutyrate dehydrogenase-like beta-hydroxyacid dehydrogenase
MRLQDNSRVAMIGLGNMGRALADALLAREFRVAVWNRTPAKADLLEKADALVAPSVAEAARGADVLVVCLLDHAATREAVMTAEVGAVLKGKTLVQLSTARVDEVDELARWAEINDIAFLKGAILVYPDAIRAGSGEILYGGPRDLFDRLRPVLDAMGGRPSLVSDRPAHVIAPTSACYSFLYSSLLSFLHGAAICHRSGVSVETFTRNVIEPFVAGGSLMRFLDSVARAAGNRRYDEDLQATLDVWNDALGQTIAEIEAADIDTATLQPFKALLDRTVAGGYGQKDIAAVFETLIAEKR